MDANRKYWREQQQELRRALTKDEDYVLGVELFLSQHGMLHAGEIAGPGLHSFVDEILEGMTAEHMRRIPVSEEHSVAWCFWHMARIEDVTMNILLAGKRQILLQDDWLERLHVPMRDTGNVENVAYMVALGETVDLKVLLAYRTAVGRATRENVRNLTAEELQQGVDPQRLQQLLDDGALAEEAFGLADFWGRKTLTELLLMPPTGHNMVHLNEARRIKQRRR